MMRNRWNGYRENQKVAIKRSVIFIKWMVVSLVVGLVGGILGSAFHHSIEYVTHWRMEHGFLVYLLPLGGLLIAFFYGMFRKKGALDTNRILEAARGEQDVPLVLLPLIYFGTVVTHLLGGSAGREGAALQLGGSMGYHLGRLFRLSRKELSVFVMAGMSGVFSALFGTPITAAVFSIEVTEVGKIRYRGLVPCVLAALTAYGVSQKMGVAEPWPKVMAVDAFRMIDFGKVAVLAGLLALVSILFCLTIKQSKKWMEKLLPNGYLRAVVGGLLIVGLTVLLRTRDYNGAGTEVLLRALQGTSKPEAFFWKIAFTAITISAGFKGGEIVPTFFIGATFGAAVAPVLGIDPSLAAALGMVTLFGCVTNCPMASILLSAEMFGTQGLWFFALSVSLGYLLSGKCSLYGSQRIPEPKLLVQETEEPAEEN